jgi:hypothetical protein
VRGSTPTPTSTTRGRDFAAGIWVVDPVFMLDAVRQALADQIDAQPAADPAYFAGAGLDAPDLRDAAAAERERRHEQRQRVTDAVRTNLGLGHDLRAGPTEPKPDQLDALRTFVCRLLARDYRDLIAYGAGRTDLERQRPVGKTGRHEPQPIDTIVDAELRRALAEPDPLRGIAALVARCAAASVLDPDGVTRSKVLGSERMARKLHDALPSGDEPLRSALWAFLRPMLSPRLAELHRDAFVIEDARHSTGDLSAHRGDSTLDELDLDVDVDSDDAAAA